MKLAIAFWLFFFIAVTMARPDDGQYTDKYDNVDLEEILNNKKLLEAYIKCILDQGKCTPDGKELREHVKEAMENNCAKCTEKQKNGTKVVLKHVINNEPEYWNQLTTKYDPDKKYAPQFEKELGA